MKNYTSVSDIENLQELVEEAIQLKNENSSAEAGKGKTLGMLFFNPSLRTRLSTEKAAKLLGMEVMVMNADKDGWALEFEEGAVMNSDKAEHIKEAAAVLSQYCDIIAVRAFPGLVDREKDEADIVISSFLKYSLKAFIYRGSYLYALSPNHSSRKTRAFPGFACSFSSIVF